MLKITDLSNPVQPEIEARALAFIDEWAANPNRRQFGDIHTSGETLLVIGSRGYRLLHFPFHCEYGFGTVEFTPTKTFFTLTEGPYQKLGGVARA